MKKEDAASVPEPHQEEADASATTPVLGFLLSTAALLVLMLVTVLPVMLVRGYALARLWTTFIEPVSPSVVPHMSPDRAIGVILVFTLFRGTPSVSKSKLGVRTLFDAVVKDIMLALSVLFIAEVVVRLFR